MNQEQTDQLRAQIEAKKSRDDHEAFFNGWIEDEDAELEKVVRLLRAKSSHAFLCGQTERSQIFDEIVAELERHEHRD
jgi:hypothetical protein